MLSGWARSRMDYMPGGRGFSRGFRRGVLSGFSGVSDVWWGMSGDSKNLFGFSADKFSEFVHTVISLGCRKLGNSTLLIRLPNTVSNGLN